MSDNFYRTFEETHRGDRQLIKDRLAVYLPFVEPLLQAYPAASAIDLGCGRGEWLETLRSKGFRPTGVDLDADMLKACHEAGLEVIHDDALKVLAALPEQSQVLVSAFHVVEHIGFDQLQTLIAHALRVLKPGGLLVMETPNPENIMVGTTGFYLDPTHQRPIHPLLLSFLTEFNHFPRVKTLRLQEPSCLMERKEPGLLDVFGGVSPDYAVVAQKQGDSDVMAALDAAFEQNYGITLESLASRYDAQINARIGNLNARLSQSASHTHELIQNLQENLREQIAQQAADTRYWHEQAAHWQAQADQRYQQILHIYNSASWRVTRPLRGLKRIVSGDFSPVQQLTASAEQKMKAALKIMLRASIACVMRHPTLQYRIQSSPRLFLWLKARANALSRFSARQSQQSRYAHPLSSGRVEQIYRLLETAQQQGADAPVPLAPLPFPLSVPQKRPRLAYISPLPPEASGISDYSAELLPVLSRWYEIDVIVIQDEIQEEISDPWIQANCPVRSLEWLHGNAGEFDRVLYHFGNSHFHRHMFDLLDKIPGIVVLHDFYISGIQSCREGLGWGAPYAWMQALYNSHGYPALIANQRDQTAAIWQYPANLPVLQAALGIIVHSEYARNQAARWYEPRAAETWAVLPHLRVAVQNADRASARQALGMAPKDFLVCTFGNLGLTKQNERLLKVWLQSPLAQDPHAKLVFAGGGSDLWKINQQIKTAGMEARILVTGRLSAENFRHYLAAADIGVQLRALSRGETSGTVLDCMNYSLATIVNANGSLADLDPAAVWLLPDEFNDHELAEALTTLWRDPERRQTMGQYARKVVETLHDPEYCAKRYAEAIENHYRTSECSRLHNLITQISHNLPEPEIKELAVALAEDFPPTPKKRRILVDISELVTVDVKTGIQRVVRAILLEWLRREEGAWQVEPVYATPDGYLYARKFTSRFLDIPGEWAEDAPVEAWAGALFFGLDLNPGRIVEQKTVLEHWRNRGVKIGFLVYDLLPVLHPEFFGEGAAAHYGQWLAAICGMDFAICISRSVAEELQQWRAASEQVKQQRPYHIGWSHIGADLEASVPTRGIPPEGTARLRQLRDRPGFLMVGTLEPRKAHSEVLDAFEKLWAEGKDINLIIVGKKGWLQDTLLQRLHARMAEEKRLIWLEGISDEYLEAVYAASSCLIAAAYAEGFGLPLIEAANHKLPIIARYIPVFREVAGQHAYYFSDDLAHGIETWLALHAQNQHPKSDQMPRLSWHESAEQLWKQVTAQGAIMPHAIALTAPTHD